MTPLRRPFTIAAMDSRPLSFLLAAMVLSCAPQAGSSAEESPSGESDGQAEDIASPAASPEPRRKEVRVPFIGGAFVTYSGEMPADVHQAIAGEKTDHPVIVWAGE